MSSSGAQAAGRRRGLLQRAFGWFDAGLDWCERFVLVAAIGGMAAVSVANVILRNTIGSSLQFAGDVSQLLLVAVTFMGIGFGARHARHIRVSAIHDLLPEMAQKVLLIFISLGTSALLFLLADYAWGYAKSVQRSCRVLPEAFGALPLWLGVVFTLAAMVLFGHLVRVIAGRGASWLETMTPATRSLVLAAAIVLGVAAGAVLFALFIELVEARAGRCRVMPSTGFPVYLVYMVVPLGFLLGGIQFLLAGIRNLTSRDNYLSWYRRDEYESEAQAARQASLGRAGNDD